MWKRASCLALAGLLLCASEAQAVRGADAPKQMTEQEKEEAREEAKYEKVIDFLLKEYGRIGESKDWLTRGLTTISVARLPQSKANRTLLKILKEDSSPMVSLVAWECLLARAHTVDPEQFETWLQLTPGLVSRNVFNGRLRVELLQFLALSPPDAHTKKIFWKVLAETNSLMPNDIPVIEELGHLLAAWRSPDLVQGLIEKIPAGLNDAYRIEMVLHAAGCPVSWAGNRSDMWSGAMWELALKDYVDWWKSDKQNWKEVTARKEGTPWREMSAKYLNLTLFDRELIKNNDPAVRKDLELGNPSLRAFDVMFVVDATESMQPPMDWLRGELRKMMVIMGMMSSQPRIGLTFYRDTGPYGFVAKTLPLTRDVDSLIAALREVKALGGGDVPEAVRDGLADCCKSAGWDIKKKEDPAMLVAAGIDPKTATQPKGNPGDPPLDPKAMILFGDAPPKPGTEDDCLKIASKAAEQGIKIYAVKLTTPLGEDKGNLPVFDQVASTGKGVSIAAEFGSGRALEFRGTPPRKNGNITHVSVAKAPPAVAPSQELLTRILLDAVNAKYKERIEMIVPILLEACEMPTPEMRAPFKAAAEPAKSTGAGPAKPTPKPQQK